MIMRPDEIANRAEIERDERFRSNISSALGTGMTAAGGVAMARVLPFLSQYVPVDLAVKGISKVSPTLGDFLKRGQSMGLKVEEGLQYIKDSMSPKQGAEPPKDNRNLVEQYSPELHQFIMDQMQKGRSALEAGALATLETSGGKGFKKVIDQITKDHKSPWASILQSVYSTQEGMAPNQQQQPSSQPGSKPGKGQQALMDILQKLQQMRGSQ